MKINNILMLILIINISLILSGVSKCNERVDARGENKDTANINAITKIENNYDSILNVDSYVTIKEDSIKNYLFKIEKQEPFFIAINKNKIIAKLDDSNQIYILNPYTNRIYKKLNLNAYSFNYVQTEPGGFVPDFTTFIRSNDNRFKIIITGGFDLNSFSVSNLGDPSKPSLLKLNNETKSLVISNFKNIFYSEDLLFINDTLYSLKVLDKILILENKKFLYSFNRVGEFLSFNFKNGENLKIGHFSASLFPLNNKIFFWDDNKRQTALYRYDVNDNYSKKYILPFLAYYFFFAEDGFFVLCNEFNSHNRNSDEFDIYCFIKY
jgi:hypothetical protein